LAEGANAGSPRVLRLRYGGLGCRALDDMPFLGSQTKFLTAKEEGFVK